MRHSVQPRDRILVKCYGFLSFAKNIAKNISKILRDKYSQKLLDHHKKIWNRCKFFKRSHSKDNRSNR